MKKKLIFSVLIMLISINALGQIEKPITKGSFLIGGSLNFGADKYNYIDPDGQIAIERDHTNFEGGVNQGYFIFNSFSAGLEIDYLIKRTDYGQSITTSDEVMIGPSIRYYLNIGIFGTGSLGIGYDYSGPKDSQTKYRDFLWNIGLGYSVFLIKTLHLNQLSLTSF